MFEPIQRYLPQYFNNDPEKREAMRLRAPAGTTAPWEIRDERLIIAWADQSRVYEFHDHTVGSLVDALQAEGFTLDPGYDQMLLALGAVVLLEGRGTLLDFSGTPFYGFTSLLHAITRPVEREWRLLHAAIPDAAAQVSLADADSDWLDVHGDLYGIPRLAGMDDVVYRQHLLDEVKRPRNNPRGIEHTLRRWSGQDIQVREPWQEIFTLSASRLSGRQFLEGAPVYQYHTMQLVASAVGMDWALLQAIADADRPAGTVLLPPATHPGAVQVGDLAAHWALAVGGMTHYGYVLPVNSFGRLSVDLSLSHSVPPPGIAIGPISCIGIATVGLRGPYQESNAQFAWTGLWDERPWSPVAAIPVEMIPPITLSES